MKKKTVEYMNAKCAFAQDERWERALLEGSKVWLRPANLGDRRVLIDLFNTMLFYAPGVENEKES